MLPGLVTVRRPIPQPWIRASMETASIEPGERCVFVGAKLEGAA